MCTLTLPLILITPLSHTCYTPLTHLTGPYLDDPKVAKQFTDAYMEMVSGFLTFPLKFPGTAVWRAMKVG